MSSKPVTGKADPSFDWLGELRRRAARNHRELTPRLVEMYVADPNLMRTRLPIAFAFVERLVNAQSIAEVQEVNRSPLEQRKVELQRELLERFEVTPMLKLGMRLEEFVELMEQSASAGKLDPRIRPIRDPRVTVDC